MPSSVKPAPVRSSTRESRLDKHLAIARGECDDAKTISESEPPALAAPAAGGGEPQAASPMVTATRAAKREKRFIDIGRRKITGVPV